MHKSVTVCTQHTYHNTEELVAFVNKFVVTSRSEIVLICFVREQR